MTAASDDVVCLHVVLLLLLLMLSANHAATRRVYLIIFFLLLDCLPASHRSICRLFGSFASRLMDSRQDGLGQGVLGCAELTTTTQLIRCRAGGKKGG